jgi:hypothetical protein
MAVTMETPVAKHPKELRKAREGSVMRGWAFS